MVEAASEGETGELPDYTLAPPRLRRIGLAIFLCGLAACVIVTMIGVAALFGLRAVDQILLGGDGEVLASGTAPLMRGAMIAGLAAAMNWLFFYLTIPAAWLALGFSLGRFPRRGILHGAPYQRWGAIVGAVLVALPTLLGAAAFAGDGADAGAVLLGAAGMALGLGALSGLACAGLFLAIVRPERQVRRVDAEVF